MARAKKKPTKRQFFDRVIDDENKLDALQERIDKLQVQWDTRNEKVDDWRSKNVPDGVEDGSYEHKGFVVSIGSNTYGRTKNVSVYAKTVYKKV
jgi:hypothetical protein